MVDTVLLAALRATGVRVEAGDFTAPVDDPTMLRRVDIPLPYAIYYSSIGDDHNPRLSGRRMRRSVFFGYTYVGKTQEQAKAAGERLHDALEGVRFVIPGHRSWQVQCLESQRVRKDDTAIHRDGSPLFYGVENYDLAYMRKTSKVGATP